MLCKPAICTCVTYRLHNAKQPEGLCYVPSIWNVYVTLRYVPVFTYRLHNAKQSKVLYTCADYICYIIYICYVILRYVPVLPHTDYIMQTVESYIYMCNMYLFSHIQITYWKNSRKGYICRYTECLKLCDMYLFTYRIHNTKQPRWPYICICINHTEC
jgi:hypothetical protein